MMVVFHSPAESQDALIWKQWGEHSSLLEKPDGRACYPHSATHPVPPQRQRRRVAFKPILATVIRDQPFKLTREEKSRCFFDRQDRLRFEKDRIAVSMMYEWTLQANLLWTETNEQTIRGLEDFFTRQSKESKRKYHVRLVLQEQARQTREEICEGDTLRYVSSSSSAEARHRCLALGQRDALEAARPEIATPSSSPLHRNCLSRRSMDLEAMDEAEEVELMECSALC